MDIKTDREGKINVANGFYSQWERKLPARNTSQIQNRETRPAWKSKPAYPLSPSANSKRILEPIKDAKASRIRFLEVKCASTKIAANKFKVHEMELTKANLSLRQIIDDEERPSHGSIKALLRRYEKYRGGMSFLGENFKMTLAREKQSLNELQITLDIDLGVIQQEVDTLEGQLKERIENMHVLNNYKDKEYPVKAIKIADLMKELDKVEMDNEDDLSELEHIVESELGILRIAKDKEASQLREHAMSETLGMMHPSLKEMAEQNQVMAGEIELNHKQQNKLEEEISKLKAEVDGLLKMSKTNLRMHVFPEFFKYDSKCTPDMDIVLDIPKFQSMVI